MEMLRSLAEYTQATLVVAAPYSFDLGAPMGIESVVVADPRMSIRWLRVFWYLYTQCSPSTPLVCYNPSLHVLPALWLRWLGRTVIVDYVDVQGTVVESERPMLRRLGVLVEKLFLRSCDRFITSSTAITDRIRTYNPSAKIHMYRGTFHAPPCLGSDSLDLPSDVLKIMYLGLMHDFSGVRELVRAFAAISADDVHLYMVGHGPAKEACIRLVNELAQSNISFPTLDDEALHPFMQQMDMLAIPYLDVPRNQSNFPSKIIEYLWAGKAILGTEVGEIKRVLRDGQTAVLVPPDQAGLEAGLRRLVEDADLRRRLGANARAEFERRYSPEVVGQELNEFIAELSPR